MKSGAKASSTEWFHGKTSSCGGAICFYGSKAIDQIKKISDKSGRIILAGTTIGDTIFVQYI